MNIEYFIIICLLVFLLFAHSARTNIIISFSIIRDARRQNRRNMNHLESHVYPGDDAYKYCVPIKKPKTYSTSKDLCITPIFGFENNFAVNLFSIRKSGCAATIVILSDKATYFSDETTKLMTLFKVKICKGIFDENSKLKRHVDFMRDTLCFQLLKKIQKQMKGNKASYDRVFFFDSFDVYFEKDPFKYFEKKDIVYFFQEADVKLADSSFNANGVSGCFGFGGLDSIIDKPIICSGTMAAGSVASFVNFLNYFVHLKCFTDSNCPYDQGALIYVIHAGLLTKKNIKYHVFPPDGPVAACKIGPIDIQKKYFKNNQYVIIQSLNNQHKYEVVHQYTSIQTIKDGFEAKTHYHQYVNEHEKEIKNDAIETVTITI